MAFLDVREDLHKGNDPFQKIMSAMLGLAPGEELEIIAPFEPVPLYTVLGAKGFRHQTEKTSEGDWRVVFHRGQQRRELGQ